MRKKDCNKMEVHVEITIRRSGCRSGKELCIYWAIENGIVDEVIKGKGRRKRGVLQYHNITPIVALRHQIQYISLLFKCGCRGYVHSGSSWTMDVHMASLSTKGTNADRAGMLGVTRGGVVAEWVDTIYSGKLGWTCSVDWN